LHSGAERGDAQEKGTWCDGGRRTCGASLHEAGGGDGAPFDAAGAAGAAAEVEGTAGTGGVGDAAGGAGGLEERNGEEGAFAAAAGAGAHLDGELAPEATVACPRVVLELGDGVGVFVAERLDGLVVARDVAAETDALALLIAVAGFEVGDLETDVDAVAEGEPVEVEGEGFGVEGEGVFGWCEPRVHVLGVL